jgi:hypothetical protein
MKTIFSCQYLIRKFESLIVFGIVTGLLLPARLLFVQYVSDDWLGSLGVISAISILIIVLARKKKLGFFGPMFERQMYKFQKGKRGVLVFGESLLLLLMLGIMIFAIDQGNTVYSDLKLQTTANSASVNSEQILEISKGWDASDWTVGFLMAPIALFTSFPQMSATIASIDQSLDGWLLHFYTVGFVEYLELFGIFIFYRFLFKNKLKSFGQSTSYRKSAIWNYS